MRVALVSPYSWTVPGGVSRHVGGLARELRARGHDARVLAPFDGGEAPPWLVPMGGSTRFRANGAESRVAVTPFALSTLRTELVTGGYDVVHLHEPVAPILCWDALTSARGPLVGTFHVHGERRGSHGIAALGGARRRMNRLHVRIAVSEAAAETGRRFWGGHYRVIPNGVALPAAVAPAPGGVPFRVVFVGAEVRRKGLDVLRRAWPAVAAAVPGAELRLVGTDRRVTDAERDAELAAADVLCAPSLGGESFGLVLAEAFAQGTPAVASDIPGYREVVDAGSGVLVPPGDADAMAAALVALARDPARRAALARGARARAEAFAWPRVADRVLEAYDDARAVARTAPAGPWARLGLAPADGRPRVPATESFRRPVLGALALAVAGLAAARLDWGEVGRALLGSSPPWTLLALALMTLSLGCRGLAWHAILRAAEVPGRAGDAVRASAIGVLMSATLPARLGEPARAVVRARRAGPAGDHLPAVAGTLVAQTALNVAALLVLAACTLHTVARPGGLIATAVLPVVALAAVALGSRHPRLRPVRAGLRVFRDAPCAVAAASAQGLAWVLQWLACLVLLRALELEPSAGAAAAVLLAVNVSAVLPATPSNLGVFQAACVAVLTGAFGATTAAALGYGIVLQAVELAVAVLAGLPALLAEGLTWRGVRTRAVRSAAPAAV